MAYVFYCILINFFIHKLSSYSNKHEKKSVFNSKTVFLECKCFIFVVSQVFFAQCQFEYKLNATLQIIIDYK